MSAYKRTLKKQTSYEKRCNRTVKERLRWGWTVKAQLTVSRSGHGAHLSSMWEMKWAFRVLSEGLRAQPLCSVNDQLFGYLRFYIWEQDPKRTQCSSLPGHTHTHTHRFHSFPRSNPLRKNEKLYLAVWIRQDFWQPTFNFHLSFRVLTHFWRDKLSRILKKKFSKMTFTVMYSHVPIFYCSSTLKVAYPGILNAFHV